MLSNKLSANFVGGEISPQTSARVDLPLYQKAMARIENFVVLSQGGARFRNGTIFVKKTKSNNVGKLVPFEFNDKQAYLIEATDGFMRFYTQNGIVLETPKTITGVTNANPGVITSTAHGFANGDEVFIAGILGTTQVNGQFFVVANVTANTFTLQTIELVNVDTTLYGVYVSGGTAARVYTITTPYRAADLPYLQWAQSADTMYIVHQNYEPRKLVRNANANWTLATFVRTNDPFTATFFNVSGITNANPGVITTSIAHGFVVGSLVTFAAVGGTTQLNGNFYLVGTVPTTTTFTLTDLHGNVIDTTLYGVWTAGGTVTTPVTYPGAVTFIDSGRVLYGGSVNNPQTIWGSNAPSGATGNTDYDNFTTGVAATNAIIFTLAPVHGEICSIQWMSNTSLFIIIGTIGEIRLLYGADVNQPISVSSVTAKSVNDVGTARTLPLSTGPAMFYIQRGNLLLRSLEFDILQNTYATTNRNLVANHLVAPGLSQLIKQQAVPDVAWMLRADGKLLGLTYNDKEGISAWHRHYIGGSSVNSNGATVPYAKITDIGRMARPLGIAGPTSGDQVWCIVERVIGVNTIRSVEFIADEPVYPIQEDFYTGDQDVDLAAFNNNMWETQKNAIHLDMAVSYDGSALGTSVKSNITPSGIAVGAVITVTASQPIFTAAMVGRQIWKAYDVNGAGGGRATITAFTSSTVVTCTVVSAFDNTNSVAYGNWYLTSALIGGLAHLEGQTINVTADGGVQLPALVTGGQITLSIQASKVTAGYQYTGTLIGLNTDSGGLTGTAEAKLRVIYKACIRFLNTLGTQFGTNIYSVSRILYRKTQDPTARPTPLFTGLKEELVIDDWDTTKAATILHDEPVPCTVLSIDLFMQTSDEDR